MNNNRYYLLTGAAGFLGTNICMQLLEAGCKVRALVLPNDKSVKFIPEQVEVVLGDLTDAPSLEPFFTVPEGCTSVVIHCASMVTVNPNYSEKLMAVNVGGTRNIITKVLNHPECEKLVYVSSTGAIPEQPHGTPITEVSKFTPCDPKLVVGAYSQSKATATQMVLDAVNVMGLKACVVHPSGILGPNDHAIDDVQGALKGMIAPKIRDVDLGAAEVRQVYKISSVGTIAGCYVTNGVITRNSIIRVVRDGIIIYDDNISSLKRFKDDVKEVAQGYECGISLGKFNDIKEGDILEAYKKEEYRE